MSASDTPLSDSKQHWCPECGPSKCSIDVVPLDDCRAIERRLNECVKALEHVCNQYQILRAARGLPYRFPDSITRANEAIANAKSPMTRRKL